MGKGADLCPNMVNSVVERSGRQTNQLRARDAMRTLFWGTHARDSIDVRAGGVPFSKNKLLLLNEKC